MSISGEIPPYVNEWKIEVAVAMGPNTWEMMQTLTSLGEGSYVWALEVYNIIIMGNRKAVPKMVCIASALNWIIFKGKADYNWAKDWSDLQEKRCKLQYMVE